MSQSVARFLVWLAMFCAGCASVEPVRVSDARSSFSAPGLAAPVEVVLAEDAALCTNDTEFAGGHWRHLTYRDRAETWFRSRLSLERMNAAVAIRHSASIRIPARAEFADSFYICRGWAGFSPALPPNGRLAIKEDVHETPSGRRISRGVLSDDPGSGSRFQSFLPIQTRLWPLTVSNATAELSVTYEVEVSSGNTPVDVEVYLSPQIMTSEEEQIEWKALWDAGFAGLRLEEPVSADEERRRAARQSTARRFGLLYLDTAGDYVMSHLPRHERRHCYLQSALVREWFGLVIEQYPEVGEVYAMTGLRRAPFWQSSNLLWPVGEGMDAELSLKTGFAWVLDTWRVDGGTETKIQTVREFRKPLNVVRLEEAVEAGSCSQSRGVRGGEVSGGTSEAPKTKAQY